MKKIIGYTFLGLGSLGVFYFLNYSGELIKLKGLWLVLSFMIAGCGLVLLAWAKWTSYIEKQNRSTSPSLMHLFQSGKKITITLENCKVKSRTFQEEQIPEGLPSRIEMLDSLYDQNRNLKTNQIVQTYIVYNALIKGKEFRFISNPTAEDPVYVRQKIISGKISLFYDDQDPSKYIFDIPFL